MGSLFALIKVLLQGLGMFLLYRKGVETTSLKQKVDTLEKKNKDASTAIKVAKTVRSTPSDKLIDSVYKKPKP